GHVTGVQTCALPISRPAAAVAAPLRAARAVAVRFGPGLAFLTLIVLWVSAYVVRGLQWTVNFPGYEGDGPFQLFNPLRRIAAGRSEERRLGKGWGWG